MGFSNIKIGDTELTSTEFIDKVASGEIFEKKEEKTEEKTEDTDEKTEEKIEEKIEDTEEKTEDIDDSKKIENSEPSPEVTEENSEEKIKTEPKEEKKIEDDWLGYGSKEKLQKKVTHQDAHIKRTEAENAELRKQIKEINEKTKKSFSELKPLEMPKYEDYDNDLLEDKDVEIKRKNDEKDRLIKEEMIKRINELEKRDKKNQQVIDKLNNREIMASNMEAQNKYWDSIEALRKDNPSFCSDPDVKMRDCHKECKAWENSIAADNGIEKPYDDDEIEWINYQEKVSYLVKCALDGDEKVICKELPKGAKDYYALGDLEAQKNKLISDGVLAKAATLKDANIILLDRSGQLRQNFKEEAENAFLRGKVATEKALTEGEQTYATTIKDKVPINNVEDKANEIRTILKYTAEELRDPKKEALFHKTFREIGTQV